MISSNDEAKGKFKFHSIYYIKTEDLITGSAGRRAQGPVRKLLKPHRHASGAAADESAGGINVRFSR